MRERHEKRRSSLGNIRLTSSSTPTTSTAGYSKLPSSSASDEHLEVTYLPDEPLIISSLEPTIHPVDIQLNIRDTGSPRTSGLASFNLFERFSSGFITTKNWLSRKRVNSFSTNRVPRRLKYVTFSLRSGFPRSRSRAHRALTALQFIVNDEGLASRNEVMSKFEKLVSGNEDGCLNRIDFPQCIGMGNSRKFALALFDALSREKNLNKLSKDEFLDYWTKITDQDFDSRLKLFFSMMDKNDDGQLTRGDVVEIIELSASTCMLSALKDQAGEYADLIMETLDQEGFGYIELEQLESILLDKSMYTETTNVGSTIGDGPSVQKMRSNMSYFLQDNWKRIWVLCLWIFTMVGLFTWKFFQYKNNSAYEVMGYCLTTAKGAAETLKFNIALILFPVCRNTITWLRSTRFAYAVPFDDNINFHKTIAGAIVVGITLHAGLHLTCDFVRLEQSSETDYYLYLTQFNHNGKRPSYGDLVRGWEGVTGIIMVVLMAIAFTLATRNFRRSVIKLPKPFDRFIGFNAFWYSHHLFIIVYTCLIIHGTKLYLVHEWYKKTTWMYLAVPTLLYAGERTLRHFRSGLNNVRLLKVLIYPGDVLTLQMEKPPRFRYKSGQYMFVKFPVVSSFEWHPFSITSSPGDGFLSVHIRRIGDWTKDILEEYKKFCEPVPDRPEILRGNETISNSWPKLVIDGPYGAPAQEYCKYDVLLLVSSGIGATPFISILRDLINTFRRQQEKTGFPGQRTPRIKAYFYWVTKELGSFDWFREVMSEVADLDEKGIIELHNHLTNVYEEGDARSTLIGMIAALERAKKGLDLFSGTKVRTHFGRPDWGKVISNLGSKHPNAKIGFFYCGVPNLAKDLKGYCNAYNRQGGAQFEFHKDQF